MARGATDRKSELSRRDFLITTSVALAGVAACGLVDRATASKRHPQRGGVLQYSSRVDTAGLDAHRHVQLHSSHPTAAMYTGLTDIDQQGHIVPGIALSWEPNKDLTAWTFRLGQGVLFHNGREVDAEAVKLNLLRLKTPPSATASTAAQWKTSPASMSSISTRCGSMRRCRMCPCRRASCATRPAC